MYTVTHILLLAIRPIMPTAQVCAKFEQLQTAIISLLDLKRQVDRQENDLKVKKAQKSKDGTPTTPNQDGGVNRVRSRVPAIVLITHSIIFVDVFLIIWLRWF